MRRKPTPVVALERNLRLAGWFDAAGAAFEILRRRPEGRVDVREGQVLFRGPLGTPSAWWLTAEGEVLIADHERVVTYSASARPRRAPPRKERVSLRLSGRVIDWLVEQAEARGATVSEVAGGLLERAFERASGGAK